MSQRALLTAGIVAIATSLVFGVAAMGFGQTGSPMRGWFVSSGGGSISMERAQQSVQSFLDRSGDGDLKIDELMEFQDNFYALVKEKSTGVGAFELLVNKSTGAVGFEPGPDMMWNTKYGMMGRGGMMGGFRPVHSGGQMTIAADQASRIAQSWLGQHFTGDSAGTPDAFYGYYTFHFLKNGKIDGMLSVNGFTGQVWYHSWHGAFIEGKDFAA